MWRPYFKNTRWDTGSVKCQYLEKTRGYDQEKATLAAEGKEKKIRLKRKTAERGTEREVSCVRLESEAGT